MNFNRKDMDLNREYQTRRQAEAARWRQGSPLRSTDRQGSGLPRLTLWLASWTRRAQAKWSKQQGQLSSSQSREHRRHSMPR